MVCESSSVGGEERVCGGGGRSRSYDFGAPRFIEQESEQNVRTTAEGDVDVGAFSAMWSPQVRLLNVNEILLLRFG